MFSSLLPGSGERDRPPIDLGGDVQKALRDQANDAVKRHLNVRSVARAPSFDLRIVEPQIEELVSDPATTEIVEQSGGRVHIAYVDQNLTALHRGVVGAMRSHHSELRGRGIAQTRRTPVLDPGHTETAREIDAGILDRIQHLEGLAGFEPSGPRPVLVRHDQHDELRPSVRRLFEESLKPRGNPNSGLVPHQPLTVGEGLQMIDGLVAVTGMKPPKGASIVIAATITAENSFGPDLEFRPHLTVGRHGARISTMDARPKIIQPGMRAYVLDGGIPADYQSTVATIEEPASPVAPHRLDDIGNQGWHEQFYGR